MLPRSKTSECYHRWSERPFWLPKSYQPTSDRYRFRWWTTVAAEQHRWNRSTQTTSNCCGDLAADGYRMAGTLSDHYAWDPPYREAARISSCHPGHASSAGHPSYDPCQALHDHRDRVHDLRIRCEADHLAHPGTRHEGDQTCPSCVDCYTVKPAAKSLHFRTVLPRARQRTGNRLELLWSLAVTFLGEKFHRNHAPT